MKKKYDVQMVGNKAEIKLTGAIDWWNNSGAEFTAKIDDVIAKGITSMHLYINSEGGSWMEANEIYLQFKKFKGEKTCTIGGLCASAATLPTMAFDKVTIAETGLYMIHMPSTWVSGSEKELTSALNLLQTITDITVGVYAKKTGLSTTVLYNMMEAETWMSASVAKDKGFVSEVVTDIDNVEDVTELLKGLYPNAENSIENAVKEKGLVTMKAVTIKKANTNTMNKPKMIAALALQDTASDDQIVEAIVKMSAKLATTEKELEDTKKSVASAKAKILIDNAIAYKKIAESERAEWMETAMSSFEVAEKVLAKIPAPVQLSKAGAVVIDSADRANWKWEDYQKNDANALIEMRASDKSKYKELYKAHYGVEASI